MARRKAAFYILFPILFAVLLFSPKVSSKSTSFIVIANASIPIDTISAAKLRDIYNGDRVFWTSGKRIRAVRLPDHDQTHVDFSSAILGKTPSQYVQHWRHKLFSGKGLPPKVIEDSDKMFAYIEETDGSIGVIPATARTTSTKIKVLEISE